MKTPAHSTKKWFPKVRKLQTKRQLSTALSPEEVSEFETCRDQLLNNPVAKGFLDAQERMRTLHHSVTKYVTMTLETGRVPSPEDVAAASCGNGCNCDH